MGQQQCTGKTTMENNIPNINIPEPKNDLQYAMATIGLISVAGGVAIGKTNPVIGGAICLAGVAGVTVICFKALEDISSKRRAEHEAQRLLEKAGIHLPSAA